MSTRDRLDGRAVADIAQRYPHAQLKYHPLFAEGQPRPPNPPAQQGDCHQFRRECKIYFRAHGQIWRGLTIPRVKQVISQGNAMNRSISILFTAITLALGGIAAPAAAAPGYAQCNPPRHNLEYPAWRSDCDGMLQMLYRANNPYGCPIPSSSACTSRCTRWPTTPNATPACRGRRVRPRGGLHEPVGASANLCAGPLARQRSIGASARTSFKAGNTHEEDQEIHPARRNGGLWFRP